ncbi:uncharacterized protein LOC131062939 [Cryptomeria japonica]|uniref:uncharacterized protein LOC131062939 n=1 Tax=Cryptomeria japonica TaxID=3369 RepID=UPI0027DA6940|nr:uncharacterized protein LOC131062939 [Cryptomeria japonica]
MITMLRLNLFDIHPFHSHKQLVKHPFHSRTSWSSLAITNAHTQSLFSHFASNKLNMSEADITQIFRRAPRLQNLRTLDSVEQFIHYLKKRGCTDVQIAKIMRNRPSIITVSEKKLEPKIRLLEDFGFEGQTLTKLLTSNPNILSLSLEKSLLPKMMFLKSIFGTEDALVKAMLRAPQLIGCNLEKVLKPSLAFWEGFGLSRVELSKFLRLAPSVLLRSSLTPAEAVLIDNIGLDKGSKMFKYVLIAVTVSRMETLEARIENLKFWGLSAEEIWRLFRVAPLVLNFSKETIGEKMNFVVNHLKEPANSVVKHPLLLQKSLERSVRPRFQVWQKIESTTAPGLSIFKVLEMTEERFIKIIEGHPDSEILWSIFENAVSDAPSGTKRSSRLML